MKRATVGRELGFYVSYSGNVNWTANLIVRGQPVSPEAGAFIKPVQLSMYGFSISNSEHNILMSKTLN